MSMHSDLAHARENEHVDGVEDEDEELVVLLDCSVLGGARVICTVADSCGICKTAAIRYKIRKP